MSFTTVITATTLLYNATMSCDYFDTNKQAFSDKNRDFAIVDHVIHPLDNGAATAALNDKVENDGIVMWEFNSLLGVRQVYVLDKTNGVGKVFIDTGEKGTTPVLFYRLSCAINLK